MAYFSLEFLSFSVVNYVCDVLAVLSATENVLNNQSKLTSRNAAKQGESE